MNGPETTIPRSSSNIAEFTYDPDTETLTVVFQSGDSYDYFNVPPSTHRAFQSAGSVGQFFHRHIRQRFPYDGPN